MKKIDKKAITSVQLYITVFYVAAILISNTIASRQILLFGSVELTGAVFIFPFTYILSDIVSEVFGYKWSRTTAWMAFGINIFMAVAFYLICCLPAPGWFTDTAAFSTVLKAVPRITAASLIAFMLGDWLNDIIFQKMKGSKDDKGYAVRATVSSIFGELVDSTVFLLLGFLGTMPIESMVKMIPLYVGSKILYEVLFLPLNTWVMKKAKKSHEAQLKMLGVK